MTAVFSVFYTCSIALFCKVVPKSRTPDDGTASPKRLAEQNKTTVICKKGSDPVTGPVWPRGWVEV